MAEIHHDAGLPRRGGALVFDTDFACGHWIAANGRTYTAPVAADGLLLVDERRPAEHTPDGLIDPDPARISREWCPAGREPIVAVPELGGVFWLGEGSPNHPTLAPCAQGYVNFEEAGEPIDYYFDLNEHLAAKNRAHATAIQHQREKEGNQS